MSRAPIEPSLKARPALVNCFLIRASWAAEYGSGLRGWSVTGSSEPSPELGIEPCLTGRPDQPVQIDPDSHGTAIGANWYMRTRRTGSPSHTHRWAMRSPGDLIRTAKLAGAAAVRAIDSPSLSVEWVDALVVD
jgi:hypothetical protein